ncbi:MAG: MFS transporter [Phycisphaerales bacterium]|nr:MFS transporter [Phycisphaerales bacterium]
MNGNPTDEKKRRLGGNILSLCSIEMFERLAYFGIRTVVPIYIMQADDPGGLHLTANHKAKIYAWWFFFQSILPVVTGGYADRYGYKRVLTFAIALNITGYVLMAFARDYTAFFTAIMVLAVGTAFFKPCLKGSLAQNLSKQNSSLGWGVFYWIANVGALIAPIVSTLILGDPHTPEAWRNLFLASAGFTSINLLLLLTFKDTPTGADKTQNPMVVFRKTLTNLFEPRLLSFLMIMSCFYVMMFQVWDLQPNFISDWIDSRGLAEGLSFLPDALYLRITETTDSGARVPQQLLLSLNPALVVLCVIPVSWIAARVRSLSALLIGMTLAVTGVLVAGLTRQAGVLLLGITVFSLGEMLTGPKKNEYLGLIAPPGKKGLYLGYVSMVAGIGGILGSRLAGHVYGRYGEKATLALRYLAEHTLFGRDKNWNGAVGSLEESLGVSRTEAVRKLQEVEGIDAGEAARLLWETYHPQYYVWVPFAATGLIAIIAFAAYGRLARKWCDMDA